MLDQCPEVGMGCMRVNEVRVNLDKMNVLRQVILGCGNSMYDLFFMVSHSTEGAGTSQAITIVLRPRQLQ